MIPKIIHYCWLSDDPYPEKIAYCIDSWKRKLPDYELRLWNFERINKDDFPWLKEAFEAKRYAFAADFVRAYALYHFGGIYLDSDVEILQCFDDLLHLPYFIGEEQIPNSIEAATMGAEKGHPLFKYLLDYYAGRHFVRSDGSLDMRTLPSIMNEIISSKFRVLKISSVDSFDTAADCISLFPKDFFSPMHWETHEIQCTQNTYSIHHFAASWHSEEDRYMLVICKRLKFLPKQFTTLFARFVALVKYRGMVTAIKELLKWVRRCG